MCATPRPDVRAGHERPVPRLVHRYDRVEGRWMHSLASAGELPVSAPAAIFVHGVAVSHRYFVPAAKAFAGFSRVFVPDLPGFGLSEAPRRVLDVPDLADALNEWMHAAGIGRAHVIGNSFGCQVIAELALRHPQNVRRIVLIGPTVDANARSMLRQFGRWFVNAGLEPFSLYPIVLRDFLDAGVWRSVVTFRHSVRDRIERKLPRITAPTVVLRGSRDAIVPQRWAEEAVSLLPRGRLAVVPRAAHCAHFSASRELVDVVRPFLLEPERTS